jgi:HAD superfamily hydrolase (TIGR01662 family)
MLPPPRFPALQAKTAKLEALPHQERVADKLKHEDTPGLLAYHGLGSGKTFTSIHAADALHMPILAIVPAPLRPNYHKELAKAGFKGPATVVSYDEALRRMHDPDFRDMAAKSLVTYDEGHRMGHIESQRSQLATNLPAKKKLILTGTPIRNDPTELAPLINAVKPGALPLDPADFRERYIHTREVPVGFWGRIVGAKPGKLSHPVNLDHFRKMIRGAVDYHQAQDRSAFPSSSEHIIEVPMSSKQQAAYDFTLGRYPALAYKIAHGLPMHRSEETDFKAFMIGPRQISNHPGGFNVSAKDSDAHKIRSMAEHIEKRYKADKNFRGVSYSSFLDAGVHPLARELKRRGIPHAIFTGSVPDDERKHIVENYNKGKIPVLIISGAGAEGLDLKGTKLMQIAEPHWQEEMINQVRGRAIRFHSHSHLPENERHVEVQRFHSIPRPSFFEKLLGRKRSRAKGVDEYIHQNAVEKQHINAPFLNILKEESEPAKAAALLTEELLRRVVQEAEHEREPSFAEGPYVHHYVLDNQRHPALLVDLDGTLVVTDGHPGPQKTGQQKVLPRRLEILRKLKRLGYKIIGITNRSLEHIPSPDHLQATIEEVFSLFPDLIDDIIYAPHPDEPQPSEWMPTHKPAPTMVEYALADHQLDPSQTTMVGDTDHDRDAALGAGVQFVFAEDFFKDPSFFDAVSPATPRTLSAQEMAATNAMTEKTAQQPTAAPSRANRPRIRNLMRNFKRDAIHEPDEHVHRHEVLHRAGHVLEETLHKAIGGE